MYEWIGNCSIKGGSLKLRQNLAVKIFVNDYVGLAIGISILVGFPTMLSLIILRNKIFKR